MFYHLEISYWNTAARAKNTGTTKQNAFARINTQIDRMKDQYSEENSASFIFLKGRKQGEGGVSKRASSSPIIRFPYVLIFIYLFFWFRIYFGKKGCARDLRVEKKWLQKLAK